MTLLFGFNSHYLLAHFQLHSILHKALIRDFIFSLIVFYVQKTFNWTFKTENFGSQAEYLHVVGVNELVLGAPWVVGGGGIAGGVSRDCVFTSTGESGIVECFSVRSGNATRNTLFHPLTSPLASGDCLSQRHTDTRNSASSISKTHLSMKV